MAILKMKLTAEQAEGCLFPIGCPVWYNFSEESSGCNEPEEPPTLKQGLVESVSLNLLAKDMIYEVVYKKDEDGKEETIVEEISEQKLAFGADCPVSITVDPNEDRFDEGTTLEEGTILFCELSPSDPGKFLYTIMISMEGSRSRYESRIDAERVKYRRVKPDSNNIVPTAEAAPAPAAPASSVPKEQHPAMKNNTAASKKSVSASAVHPAEVAVPSSIMCDSVSKSSGNKRKHAPDNASTLSANSNCQYKQSSRGLINSYSNKDVGSWKGKVFRDSAILGTRELEIKMPFWLQTNRSTQLNLYYYLSPKSLPSRRRRMIEDIEQETNCDIRVNFVDKGDKPGFRPPISITVVARSRSSGERDIHVAREKIQDLLVDFVQGDGSKGRLVYDLASSCGGDHRPIESTSRCVRTKGPFADDSREVFMTLVHLPYKKLQGMKEKEWHVSFLLTSSLLDYLWNEMDCYVKAVCKESAVRTFRCYPYLLVMGKSWRDVDRAFETLCEVMEKHVARCSCKFNLMNSRK